MNETKFDSNTSLCDGCYANNLNLVWFENIERVKSYMV